MLKLFRSLNNSGQFYTNFRVVTQSFSSSRSLSTCRLVYPDFGDPVSVLRFEDNVDIGDGQGKLVVKMLASPVNPADINTVQGNYPIKPKAFPAVGGFEGVGVVLSVGQGPNPHDLREGDMVIPKHSGSGTWTSQLIAENDEYISIPQIDVILASTLAVNPCTAYRLLKDFGDLEPGDTVIQNGGNSGVGRAVIQLCREFGLHSISIVRNRESIGELKGELKSLGDSNTIILTDEELRPRVKEFTTQLALNCIGGKVATDMMRTLEPGRVMVTYGGMARQPVIVPTSHLIFNGIALQGFWMTRWNHVSPLRERQEMLTYLAQLCKDGKFKGPNHNLIPLSEYKEAFSNSSGFTNTKYIFKFH